MLTTPHKRFIWAREEKFPDFSEFSFFRALLKRRRRGAHVAAKEPIKDGASKRWKPAPWTPWLWVK